jgi:predicted component of type VI protein secretion system
MARTNLLQRLVTINGSLTDESDKVHQSITDNLYAILTTEPDADSIRPDYGLGAYFNDRKLSLDSAQRMVNNIVRQCQLFEPRLANVVVEIDINNTDLTVSPITIKISGQYNFVDKIIQYKLLLEYNTEFKLVIHE